MEQILQFKLETHICPEEVGETEILCGWVTHQPATGKEISKLSHIYCHRPRVCWFGSDDCRWECWEALEKKIKN